MSNTAAATAQAGQETDFEFWNFVNCSLCHLPFTTSDLGPPSIPFWITECGHVLCNNHLSKMLVYSRTWFFGES